MSRSKDLQRALHQYRQATGIKDVNLADAVRYMVEKLGMVLPKPMDPYERLERDVAKALREEHRVDKKTGRPYRANHMYTVQQGERQLRLWIDIEDAPRDKMQKALTLRREQVIGDAYGLELDAEHWNSINPQEDPIQMVLDFTDDVAEKKAQDDDEEEDDAAE